MKEYNYYTGLKPIGYVGIVDYITELRELENSYDITEFLDTCEELLKVGFWLDISSWKEILLLMQTQLDSITDDVILLNLVRLKKYIILEYIKRISGLVDTVDIHTIDRAEDIIVADNRLVFICQEANTVVI